MIGRVMEDINATKEILVIALQRRDQTDPSLASERGASASKCLLGSCRW